MAEIYCIPNRIFITLAIDEGRALVRGVRTLRDWAESGDNDSEKVAELAAKLEEELETRGIPIEKE